MLLITVNNWWILMFFGVCYGSYTPVNYCRESETSPLCKSDVTVYVNRLNTEMSLIPYEYKHFDFCQIDEANSPVENLGQVIFGERIRPGPYRIQFLQDINCQKVCTRTYPEGDGEAKKRLDTLKKGIELKYQHHWIVDQMPVTWCYSLTSNKKYCVDGFPMGCFFPDDRKEYEGCPTNNRYNKPGLYYPFNHLNITITYHSGEFEDWGISFGANGGRIISIEVEPASIKNNPDQWDCDSFRGPLEIPSKSDHLNISITYTYSVKFIRNDTVAWSSRWDSLLNPLPNTDIQWHSILVSLIIILFLSGMLAIIMLPILWKDKNNSNKMDYDEYVQNESGWKLVKEDVFRPPSKGMLLSVFLGSGVHVFCTMSVTLAFACLGYLSPEDRGVLVTFALAFYVLLGTPTGYTSARIYKSFGGCKWMQNALLTTTLCPGIIFGLFFIMNMVLWSKGSSGAVPFKTFLTLWMYWLCGLMPLIFVGAFIGSQKQAIEHPVPINPIPRQIPDQSICTQPIIGILLGGILPFGCILTQSFFILNALWSTQTYSMFEYLYLIFWILIITCAETAIILCYFHLRAENYHWWWRSFFTSGCTAFYFFIYCSHYFITKLPIEDKTSTILYFGYTLIMTFLFFLMTGSIGFVACFWFVRKIYSVAKV